MALGSVPVYNNLAPGFSRTVVKSRAWPGTTFLPQFPFRGHEEIHDWLDPAGQSRRASGSGEIQALC